MNANTLNIRIPDLTRVKRKKGSVNRELGIQHVFMTKYVQYFSHIFQQRIYSKARSAGYHSWRRQGFFTDLFLSFFKVQDAIYRRDFLWELIDNSGFRKAFNLVYRGIPRFYLRHIRTEDEFGQRKSFSTLKTEVANVKKYLELPKTFELMAELSGSSEATRDLKRFGKNMRHALSSYAETVKPLKQKPLITRNDDNINVDWANHCVDKLSGSTERFVKSLSIRKQLAYYLALCAPYETKVKDGKMPFCKPEFLEPELRQGKITKAYNPYYFEFETEKNRIIVTQLNVPNDIIWGLDARNTFIHGPNNMGKSVYLRTLALNIHLGMAGLLPFAESSEMSPVGYIHPCFEMGGTLDKGRFLTGGDKIDYMLKRINIEDVVLMDEAGGGTEPNAERIISKGLSDALIKHNITSFTITHDRKAWQEHLGTEGVRLLRVADLDDKKNRYKVWEGTAKGGYAMKLAKKKRIDPESVDERLEKRLK